MTSMSVLAAMFVSYPQILFNSFCEIMGICLMCRDIFGQLCRVDEIEAVRLEGFYISL